MPRTETKTSTGTAVVTPPKGQNCKWVARVLRNVGGAHYWECQKDKKVYFDERITHTIVPGANGTCNVTITTVTTITYTDEPCEGVEP